MTPEEQKMAKDAWQTCHNLAAKLERKAAEKRDAGLTIDAADLNRRAEMARRFGNLWGNFLKRDREEQTN